MERAVLAHPADLWVINRPHVAANGYRTKMSSQNYRVPLAESQHCVIDPTNPRGALNDGVEHGLHIGGRATDDPQHLSRRRLMLQRLTQFGVALLQFLEQSHVFYGNHGLVGKAFNKHNLLVSERTNLLSSYVDDSHRTSLSDHRHTQESARATTLLIELTVGKLVCYFRREITDMNRL